MAAGSANLRGGRLCRGGIDIGADHGPPSRHETERTRSADPPTRTGNERDLSLDPPHATPPDVLSATIKQTPNERSLAY
jgi:hypothetical protein